MLYFCNFTELAWTLWFLILNSVLKIIKECSYLNVYWNAFQITAPKYLIEFLPFNSHSVLTKGICMVYLSLKSN